MLGHQALNDSMRKCVSSDRLTEGLILSFRLSAAITEQLFGEMPAEKVSKVY